MHDLSAIVKSYDIRGLVPAQLDEPIAHALGAAFARVVGAERVVLGRDMRPSSPRLAAAFAEGVRGQGADVIDIGLSSTDQLYFASGLLDCPGAMFTASHNPAGYNGVKLCRAGASPVGQDSGLREIRALAERGVEPSDALPGRLEQRDVVAAYGEHLRAMVDLSSARTLTVVVDAGNGMAGHTVPAVFDPLPVKLIPMYFDLDGSFPNHEANPIEPENLRDLQRAVVESGADAGLAFDGDADRCFVVDETGEVVSPSAITALIAVRELAKERARGRAGVVIHNVITSKRVPEIVREHGGTPVRERVGHSFIKARMAQTGAVFGGEHSGHFYFRDFWRADSGMLAALHVLAALAEQFQPLTELMSPYAGYAASGEINSVVADQQTAIALALQRFGARPGVTADHLDGLTLDGGDWWFNLRPSGTEPLLRLNVEARDAETMQAVRDDVLALVRSTPGGSG